MQADGRLAGSSNSGATSGGTSTSDTQAGGPAGSITRSSTRPALRSGLRPRRQATTSPAGRPSRSVAVALATAPASSSPVGGSARNATQHQLIWREPPSRGGSSGSPPGSPAGAPRWSAGPRTSSRSRPGGSRGRGTAGTRRAGRGAARCRWSRVGPARPGSAARRPTGNVQRASRLARKAAATSGGSMLTDTNRV